MDIRIVDLVISAMHELDECTEEDLLSGLKDYGYSEVEIRETLLTMYSEQSLYVHDGLCHLGSNDGIYPDYDYYDSLSPSELTDDYELFDSCFPGQE